jgi:hypothetical protein
MINCISKANNLLYRTSRKIWFRRERNWLVIHAFYLDIWDATRDHVLEDQHLMIDIDIYMRWYMYITCCFITPIWSCFSRRPPIQCIVCPDIQDRIDWYIIFFLHTTFIKYHINVIMYDDYKHVFNICI